MRKLPCERIKLKALRDGADFLENRALGTYSGEAWTLCKQITRLHRAAVMLPVTEAALRQIRLGIGKDDGKAE